jgi:DNA phosphorothioation-associated putative methyltransferase
VNLGYVINVIEEPTERLHVLRDAWSLARRLLIVAARLSLEAELPSRPNCFSDGFLTSHGTFQKLFEQQELRDFIDSVLGVQSVAAAPGVFYVFKDPAAREAYSASRFARSYLAPRLTRSQLLYEECRPEFQALSEFLSSKGRLPNRKESPAVQVLENKIGSIRKAFAVLQKIESAENWEQIRAKRVEDLLVYLALSRFPKRCKFSDLPQDTQLDIRACFGTYTRACEQADQLLFSAGKETAIDEACLSASFGKLTSEALYFHESVLNELPALLRIYEGCARVLIGRIEGGNVVKLHRARACVSYLSYPGFDSVAHPPLYGALIVDLPRLKVKYRDYSSSQNRPILHRKEQFVTSSHSSHKKFAKLTRQEEKHGLYDQPHLIGYEQYWTELLNNRGFRIAGHRLMRQESIPPSRATIS